jgi:hypothetical protein
VGQSKTFFDANVKEKYKNIKTGTLSVTPDYGKNLVRVIFGFRLGLGV